MSQSTRKVREPPLHVGANDLISYHVASSLLKRLNTTPEEIALWVADGDLHIFPLESDGEVTRLLPGIITQFDPRLDALSALAHFRFSKIEVKAFDPTAHASDPNPTNRYFTYQQSINHLSKRCDENYAVVLIKRELDSGRMEPWHYAVGIIDKECVDSGFMALGKGMFPEAWIHKIERQEFADVPPNREEKREATRELHHAWQQRIEELAQDDRYRGRSHSGLSKIVSGEKIGQGRDCQTIRRVTGECFRKIKDKSSR